MKRFFLAIALFAVLSSVGCSKQVTKIDGDYSYKAEFSTKRMFKDVLNVSYGDTSFISGSVDLVWKTVDEIKGKMITVESSFGNDTSWTGAKGLEVQTTGNHNEEIKEVGTYYFKMNLDNVPMNTYKVNIPTFSIISPLPTDTMLDGENVSISFSRVEGAEKYMIFVRGYKGDSLWTTETTDTSAVYEGAPLEYGMIYSVTVSTVVSPDSLGKVNLSSTNQFVIKKVK